jgi:hypothetical protein
MAMDLAELLQQARYFAKPAERGHSAKRTGRAKAVSRCPCEAMYIDAVQSRIEVRRVLRVQVRRREVIRWMVRIANCFVWSAIIPLAAAPLARLYTAENYDVSIQPDLAKQRLPVRGTPRRSPKKRDLEYNIEIPLVSSEMCRGGIRSEYDERSFLWSR